jgi:hypothetical protein
MISRFTPTSEVLRIASRSLLSSISLEKFRTSYRPPIRVLRSPVKLSQFNLDCNVEKNGSTGEAARLE